MLEKARLFIVPSKNSVAAMCIMGRSAASGLSEKISGETGSWIQPRNSHVNFNRLMIMILLNDRRKRRVTNLKIKEIHGEPKIVNIKINTKTSEFSDSPDVTEFEYLIFTETWLKQNVRTTELFDTDMFCVYGDRILGRIGGVVLVWVKSIAASGNINISSIISSSARINW